MKFNSFDLLMVLLLAFALGGLLLFHRLSQAPLPPPLPLPPVVIPTPPPPPTTGSGLPPTVVVRNLHQMGRPAFWQAKRMSLGDSGYVASVGPDVYQDEDNDDPDYFRIDIEKPEGSVSHVLFQQDFTMDEIPKLLLETPISKIVTFDEQSGTVIFQVGDQTILYQLPAPDSAAAPSMQ